MRQASWRFEQDFVLVSARDVLVQLSVAGICLVVLAQVLSPVFREPAAVEEGGTALEGAALHKSPGLEDGLADGSPAKGGEQDARGGAAQQSGVGEEYAPLPRPSHWRRGEAVSILSSPYQLLEVLNWMASTGDPAYSRKMAQIRHVLNQQGYEALSAISDFMFASTDATKVTFRNAPPGVREQVLDLMLSLDLPDIEDMAVDLLARGRLSSAETGRLTRYLQEANPGAYTPGTLALAGQAELPSVNSSNGEGQ